MAYSLQEVLEKVESRVLTVAVAKEQIETMFRDEGLRDSFAMATLSADLTGSPREIAKLAYDVADAMMLERKRREALK